MAQFIQVYFKFKKYVKFSKIHQKVRSSNFDYFEFYLTEKYLFREIELRENLVGTGFLEPPPLATRRAAQNILSVM